MRMPILLSSLICLFMCTPVLAQEPVFYYNARIWTGDPEKSWAQTLVVKDGEIIAIDALSISGRMVNLQGKLVVPGFIDNHTHFLTGGYQLNSVDLRVAKSKEQFTGQLRQFSKDLPKGRWILGGDWDHEAWGGELPTRQWADAVTPDNPLFVSRYDGHMALANSLALKLAGITKDTPSPEGGEIVKDPLTGEPTGVLKDEAMALVFKVIPEPKPEEFQEMLVRAMQHAVAQGVTQVHDMSSYGGFADLETYRKAKDQLLLRIYSFTPISSWKRLQDYIRVDGRGDDMLRWGGLKGFVDGSLGSTTAWFHRPYLDEPSSHGLIVTDTVLLKNWILESSAAGLHVAVHAIGDRANDWLLDVYQEAEKRNPAADHRFRIEHAQHLSPAAIRRFEQLKVIPSMQPYHAIDDGRWAAKRLDDERLRGTYAFNSLLKARAPLTFGSDWTVAPITPLEGIYAAVTRQTLDGKNEQGWYPQEKITVEQALRAYTSANAYAGFQENKTGMLKVGMLADFVVLSEDIFKIQPQKIKDVKVLRTVVNGREVYIRQ